MKNKRKELLFYDDGSVGVPLSNGMYSRIDNDDLELVMQHLWRYTGSHAYTNEARTGTVILMHRMLLGLPGGKNPEVDHINTDGLDNRRSNLRTVTRGQNMMNGNRRRNAKGRFKGIMPSGCSRRNPWTAQICLNGVSTHLGMFPTEEEAAMCYNVAARKYFGQFARLNQVEMG